MSEGKRERVFELVEVNPTTGRRYWRETTVSKPTVVRPRVAPLPPEEPIVEEAFETVAQYLARVGVEPTHASITHEKMEEAEERKDRVSIKPEED